VAYRLLHVSDLHAGPPFSPAIAEQLARQAHELAPDLLVISGDFVQRADIPSQWRTITSYLKTLPTPQLVVPGNHDVPLYNVFQRLLMPYSPYRRHISPELNPVFEAPGLVVVGACSAHGLTFDGGRISARQGAALRRIFARYGPDTCKVAVWHHPVVDAPGLHKTRAMSAGTTAMGLLAETGVDLLLCGHVHMGYVGHTISFAPGLARNTIICQSGTSTSKRGYGPERGKNSFNLITIDEQAIQISQQIYSPEVGAFVPAAEHSFPRTVGAL
jgi:3',5'-cyclic AMP phosphodiesterase CpdA